MANVKSLDRISNKWSRASQSAQTEYTEGVKNPRRSWADATAKAEQSYNQGVQAAIARNAFSSGVKKAGDTKWQQNAVEKGPDRWAQGVRLAQNTYEQGFAPYRDAIEKITLPPRGPKGDPKNIDRVRIVAETLHKTKINSTGR